MPPNRPSTPVWPQRYHHLVRPVCADSAPAGLTAPDRSQMTEARRIPRRQESGQRLGAAAGDGFTATTVLDGGTLVFKGHAWKAVRFGDPTDVIQLREV